MTICLPDRILIFGQHENIKLKETKSLSEIKAAMDEPSRPDFHYARLLRMYLFESEIGGEPFPKNERESLRGWAGYRLKEQLCRRHF